MPLSSVTVIVEMTFDPHRVVICRQRLDLLLSRPILEVRVVGWILHCSGLQAWLSVPDDTVLLHECCGDREDLFRIEAGLERFIKHDRGP